MPPLPVVELQCGGSFARALLFNASIQKYNAFPSKRDSKLNRTRKEGTRHVLCFLIVLVACCYLTDQCKKKMSIYTFVVGKPVTAFEAERSQALFFLAAWLPIGGGGIGSSLRINTVGWFYVC